MSNPIIEAELVPAVDEKLVKYASETGLEKPATETLVHAFAPVFAKARGALADASGVAASVKDATCVTEIKKSRACRLAIRAVRLEGETVHKKQKEAALRFGRAVDGFRNILLADLQPVEQALQDAEDTAERAEAARQAKLQMDREAELAPLLERPSMLNLGALPEADYARILADAKLLHQAKIDAIAKAQAERLAREETDRKERERIAAENARLQAEAVEARNKAEAARVEAENERLRIEFERAEERRKAEAEAARIAEISRKEREAAEQAAREAAEKAAKERAEIEAKAKAEREAAEKRMAAERAAAEATIKAAAEKARVEREVLEAKARADAEISAALAAKLKAELAAKAKAEQDAKAKVEADAKAAALAARRAAAAPDKAKLLALADAIAHIDVPKLSNEALVDECRARIRALASWIAEEAVKI